MPRRGGHEYDPQSPTPAKTTATTSSARLTLTCLTNQFVGEHLPANLIDPRALTLRGFKRVDPRHRVLFLVEESTRRWTIRQDEADG